MKKIGGWQRIWIVLSGIWLLFIIGVGVYFISDSLETSTSNRIGEHKKLVFETYQFFVKSTHETRTFFRGRLNLSSKDFPGFEKKPKPVELVEAKLSDDKTASYPKSSPKAEIEKVIKCHLSNLAYSDPDKFIESLHTDFPNIDFSEIENEYSARRNEIYIKGPTFIAGVGILPPFLLYFVVWIVRKVVIWVIKGFKG